MSKREPFSLLLPTPAAPAITTHLPPRRELAPELLKSGGAGGIRAAGPAVEQGQGGGEELRRQGLQSLSAHRHSAKGLVGLESLLEKRVETAAGALGGVGEAGQSRHQVRRSARQVGQDTVA